MNKNPRRKRIAINAAIILSAFALIAFLSYFLGRSEAPVIHTPQDARITLTNESFPAFKFEDLNEQSYEITSFKGQAVLLNFWASWCTPCLVELPQLYELARENENMSIILMSVDFDKKNIGMILDKLKLSGQAPDNLIVAWDPKKTISKDIFGTIIYPETVLINPEGQMVHKIAGAVNWFDDNISAIIKKAASQQSYDDKSQ